MWHKRSLSFATLPRQTIPKNPPTQRIESKPAFSHLRWKVALGNQKISNIPPLPLASAKSQNSSCLSTSRTVKKQTVVFADSPSPVKTQRTGLPSQQSTPSQTSIQLFRLPSGVADSQSSQNSMLTSAVSSKSSVDEDILTFSRTIVKRPSIQIQVERLTTPEDSKIIYVDSPVVRDRPATFESVVSFAGQTEEKHTLESKITAASSSKESSVQVKGSFSSNYMQKADSIHVTEGYQGECKGRLRHGRGVYVFDDGARYEGDWFLHRMCGYGKLYYPDGKLAYDGEWAQDCLHGKGNLYRNLVKNQLKIDFTNLADIQKNWIQYEGNFKFDQRNGFGKLAFSDYSIYEGQFENNIPSGRGVFTNKIRRVEGIWFQGLLQRILNESKF